MVWYGMLCLQCEGRACVSRASHAAALARAHSNTPRDSPARAHASPSTLMGSYVFVQRFLLFAAALLCLIIFLFTLKLFSFTLYSDIIRTGGSAGLCLAYYRIFSKMLRNLSIYSYQLIDLRDLSHSYEIWEKCEGIRWWSADVTTECCQLIYLMEFSLSTTTKAFNSSV